MLPKNREKGRKKKNRYRYKWEIPALQEVGGSFCRSFSSLTILLEAMEDDLIVQNLPKSKIQEREGSSIETEKDMNPERERDFQLALSLGRGWKGKLRSPKRKADGAAVF